MASNLEAMASNLKESGNVKDHEPKKRRVESQLEIVQQVHIHGQWMLPSLMHSFVGQSSIRELCPPASS